MLDRSPSVDRLFARLGEKTIYKKSTMLPQANDAFCVGPIDALHGWNVDISGVVRLLHCSSPLGWALVMRAAAVAQRAKGPQVVDHKGMRIMYRAAKLVGQQRGIPNQAKSNAHLRGV